MMNEFIMSLCGFGKEMQDVRDGKCPSCKKDINEEDFKDHLSRKEYKISGMCQECQDDFFE